MQLGFIGLGKMGGNMVHRIKRDSDHDVVAFDFNEEAVSAAEGHGATGPPRSRSSSRRSTAPRTVWIMVPAGDPRSRRSRRSAALLEPGDTIVDGGNTNGTTTSPRRPSSSAGHQLRRRRHLRRRLGAARSATA